MIGIGGKPNPGLNLLLNISVPLFKSSVIPIYYLHNLVKITESPNK